MADLYNPEDIINSYQNGSSISDPNNGSGISFRQMNMHSNGFTAPASFLEFLEAVKVNSDGSYEITNLGNLLTSLQGGNVADLITEIERELADNEADSSKLANLREALRDEMRRNFVSSLASPIAEFVVKGYTKSVDVVGKFFLLAAQPAGIDNEAGTKFIPASGYALGDSIPALNGVMLTADRFSYITDPTSGYVVGVELTEAPEENSVVTFVGLEVIPFDIAKSFDGAIENLDDVSSGIALDFASFDTKYNDYLTTVNAEIAEIQTKLTLTEGERDTQLTAYNNAKDSIKNATNSADLATAEADALKAWESYSKALDSINDLNASISVKNALITKADATYDAGVTGKDDALAEITTLRGEFQGESDSYAAANAEWMRLQNKAKQQEMMP